MTAPTPSTDEEIEALRRGLEGVTPGPWFQTGAPWFRSGDGVLAGSPDGNIAFLIADLEDFATSRDEYEGPFKLGDAERDAAHIARCSPDAIARLLSRLAEAEERARVARSEAFAEALKAIDNLKNFVPANPNNRVRFSIYDLTRAFKGGIQLAREDIQALSTLDAKPAAGQER